MGTRRSTEECLRELRLAIDRLLAGNAYRSTGTLTVTQLMREAGLPHAYSNRNPYVDLVTEFKTRTQELAAQSGAKTLDNTKSNEKAKGEDEALRRARDLAADLKTQNRALASKVVFLEACLTELRQQLATRDVSANVVGLDAGRRSEDR